jgi:hypothetical protein
LYRAACEQARCGSLVDRDLAELNARARARQQRDAGLALETLREALASGFTDGDRLRQEPALKPLRKEPEFQKLLRQLQEKKRVGE